jgi:cytochrome c
VNGFELNKIAAAMLVSLLVAMVASMVGDAFISPQKLEKNSYDIPGDEGGAATGEKEAQGPEDIKPFLAKADAANGEKIFKKCLQCHSIEKGGAAKTGPNLWGIVGGKLAHIADFAYSESLRAKGGVWDVDALNHFLYKPRAFISGTKMVFVGLSDVKERADIIAYLAKNHDNPTNITGG